MSRGAAQKPFTGSDAALNSASPAPGVQQQVQQVFTATPPPAAPTAHPQPAFVPTLPPPTATSAPSTGQYKDGTYKGPQVDAFYGLVQVQAVIQNGKIKTIQFLQYPNDDRRTSQRINSVAVPYLQQEALQAQTSNVDIISGATLTSEAFMMSLQSALANAHG